MQSKESQKNTGFLSKFRSKFQKENVIVVKFDVDDPYYQYTLKDITKNKLSLPRKESASKKKLRLLKSKARGAYANAINGFLMGSMVGGSFGSLIGLYTAIQHRNIFLFPLTALISGVSFGFFMMCGSIVRNDDQILPQITNQQNQNQEENIFEELKIMSQIKIPTVLNCFTNKNKNIHSGIIITPIWIQKYSL